MVSSTPESTNALDALTGGALSAPTSAQRSALIQQWLQSEPDETAIHEVYKVLSASDKGAAKPLRDRLDQLKQQKNFQSQIQIWQDKAQGLLAQPTLHIADALAWQRDAAKAQIALDQPPLDELNLRLSQRVKDLEDLQAQAEVLRQAALVLAQRVEVLSVKPWQEAHAAQDTLQSDIASWQAQIDEVTANAAWPGVDVKFPALLQGSRAQLLALWGAFESALHQALTASQDEQAPLPGVPVWAQAISEARQGTVAIAAAPVDPEAQKQLREQAQQKVQTALEHLNRELEQGKSKASSSAAAVLRQLLKEHGALLDAALVQSATQTLTSAGELEDWQRWRADQLRQEMVTRAQALQAQPLSGKKQQEALRQLREEWKQADKGGQPNNALWKRFDEACNEAFKTVQAWLDKLKAEEQTRSQERLALIEELKAWQAPTPDWKAMMRELQAFNDRWRQGSHLSDKTFAALQAQWKAALQTARAPLDAAQKENLALRRELIGQAQQLGAERPLRIAAIKALQQRWQTEAHSVPLERAQERDLWDAFRKPIDDAFASKDQERQQAHAQMLASLSAHDRAVLDAARALEEASSSGEAARISSAMQALQTLLSGASQAPATPPAASTETAAPEDAAATPPPKANKPLIAMRGDDRPGAKGKLAPQPASRANAHHSKPGGKGGPSNRPASTAPRLSDIAFRAQRDALEHAQAALKKHAAQARGQALTQLLQAWEQRDAEQVPAHSALGKAITAATRQTWANAIGNSPAHSDALEALLRLEIGTETPTPAEHQGARRQLQLQLLSQRHAASPAQTWKEDLTRVFASPFDAGAGKRLGQLWGKLKS